ncbi:hypothetical protein BJY00DRAFT_318388 [Aspergillus carlsbadensis]|nr:hypothetical protein BJY00DRAFT_318388 [Aspergillus carlsbadensis]
MSETPTKPEAPSLYEYACAFFREITANPFGGQRGPGAILSLPEPVLRKIFDSLSSIDQVCILLACKKFHDTFEPTGVINRREFAFPRPGPHPHSQDNDPATATTTGTCSRTTLLIRLEDNRWKFCVACLRLHPKSEFSWFERGKRPRERRCMPTAGIVDICPCMSLTFRARNKIAEYLRKKAAESEPRLQGPDPSDGLHNPQRPPKPQNGMFRTAVDRNGDTGIRHRCRVLDNSQITVDFNMVLVTNGRGWERQQLLAPEAMAMIGTYEIRGDIINCDRTLKVFLCPHVELLEHVRSGGERGNRSCCMRIDPPESNSKLAADGHSVAVRLYRVLGNGNWPADGMWARQCRISHEDCRLEGN